MKHWMKRSIFVCTLLISIAGCSDSGEFTDPIDRKLNFDRSDFKNMVTPEKLLPDSQKIEILAKTKAPPVPDIAPILAAPRPPKIGHARLVSVTVTDDVPLKDVLIELARLADVDIELDAGIEGGISFRAKEKPFNEVIERIASLSGLRYSMKNGVLRVERDLPYINTYSLDFLNIVRSTQSSINISTDVISLGGGGGGSSSSGSDGGDSGGGGGLSTGSNASITADAQDDFWESLEAGITQILSYNPDSHMSSPNLGIDALAESPTTSSEDTAEQFVINRQAGVLSASATQTQHDAISAYLNRLRSGASAQVLIEAKVVEVSLDDEFTSGINWTAFKGNTSVGVGFNPEFEANNQATFVLGDGNFGVDLDAAVQLVETFGTTRTLSSPRLHAINNQQAVLTFAENRIFFEVDIQREDDQILDGVLIPGTTTIDVTRRSVPIGIILNLMPSIDIEHNEVTLSVRPTISRQVDTVTDPGAALEGITNEIPVIEVREMDSILKIKSGQVMVIGGLMQQSQVNVDKGIPFVSGVPFLGNLFKSTEKVGKTNELVIFIRATIIGSHGNYHSTDQILYDKFTTDPRPLAF